MQTSAPSRVKTPKAEQICKRHGQQSPAEFRWRKRQLAKAERRAAKIDPENAPKRRQFAGYSD